MRKQTKKLLSWVLTGAMAIGLVSNVTISKVNAADTKDTITTGSAIASLCYSDNDWGQTEESITYWGYGAGGTNSTAKDAEVYKDGTYTVGVYTSSGSAVLSDAPFLAAEIKNLKSKVAKLDDVKISKVELKADDKKVNLNDNLVIREKDGSLRIEIMDSGNNDGTGKTGTAIAEKGLKWTSKLELTFTITGLGWDYPKFYDEELWSKAGLHAYLAYQTTNWDYRDDYNPAKEASNSFCNATAAWTPIDAYPGAEGFEKTVSNATDVLLTHDGEYTVSMSGINLSYADAYNLLSVATDLNKEVYPGVKITDIVVTVDGTPANEKITEVVSPKEDNGYYYFPLVNAHDNDKTNDVLEDDDKEVTNKTLPLAADTLAITFKITGLKTALQDLVDGNYTDPRTGQKVKDAGNIDTNSDEFKNSIGEPAVYPKEDDKTGDKDDKTPTPTPKDTKKVNGTAQGKTFTAGNFKYKVTTAATITTVSKKKTTGKVTVVGLSAAGKKKTSISVKNTVKKGTASYKVTAIDSKAFQKAKKLKKATLGTNIKSIPTSAFNGCAKLTTVSAKGVTKIGKTAFKGCKKLSKLTLKKKLSSVKKGAFKGCKKTIKVTGGTKKVNKANVKKLKKCGYKKFK
ncbi:MAG: leucine-rich repeat protein [Lachnospiraceae bacterium]|nr:leucine-rich repeat protein [Lachnospiraceae bacterium]